MIQPFGKYRRVLPSHLDVLTARLFPSARGLAEQIRSAVGSLDDARQEAIPASVVVVARLLASLYRHEDLETVMRRCLAFIGPEYVTLSPASIHRALKRLPSTVFSRLLNSLSRQLPVTPTFYGLVMKAMDGSSFTLSDTDANADRFGRTTNQHGPSEFPRVFAIALVTVQDRIVRQLRCYRTKTDEHRAGLDFLDSLYEGDLLLLDRGYPGRELFKALRAKNVHFIVRMPNTKWNFTNKRQLGPGDTEVELDGVKLRLLEFKTGDTWVRLLTSLPLHIPKRAFFDLYHQRWVIETVFGFLKNVLIAARHGQQDIGIRSKSPEMVIQEVYSSAIMLSLVSHSGAMAAEKTRLDPAQFSFATWVSLTRLCLELNLPLSDRQTLLTSPQARLPNRQPGRVYPRTKRATAQKFPIRTARHTQRHQSVEPVFENTPFIGVAPTKNKARGRPPRPKKQSTELAYAP